MTYRSLSKDDVIVLTNLFSNFADGWNKKMIEDGFAYNTMLCLGAFEGVKLVGAITYSNGAFDCDLQDIFVLDEYRHKGIATELMTKMEEQLKASGKEKIFLEVRKSNLVAISLYEKLGFIKISERKKYYGKEDALIYCKEII